MTFRGLRRKMWEEWGTRGGLKSSSSETSNRASPPHSSYFVPGSPAPARRTRSSPSPRSRTRAAAAEGRTGRRRTFGRKLDILLYYIIVYYITLYDCDIFNHIMLLGWGLRILSTSGGPSGAKQRKATRVPKSDAPKEPTVQLSRVPVSATWAAAATPGPACTASSSAPSRAPSRGWRTLLIILWIQLVISTLLLLLVLSLLPFNLHYHYHHHHHYWYHYYYYYCYHYYYYHYYVHYYYYHY